MNNTKRSEVLLKVIERIYEQHPNMQSTIGSMLVDAEKIMSLWKRYFLLFAFYQIALF